MADPDKEEVGPVSDEVTEGPPSPIPARSAWHNHFWMYFLFFFAMLGIAAWVGWYIVDAFRKFVAQIINY